MLMVNTTACVAVRQLHSFISDSHIKHASLVPQSQARIFFWCGRKCGRDVFCGVQDIINVVIERRREEEKKRRRTQNEVVVMVIFSR